MEYAVNDYAFTYFCFLLVGFSEIVIFSEPSAFNGLKYRIVRLRKSLNINYTANSFFVFGVEQTDSFCPNWRQSGRNRNEMVDKISIFK